MRKTTGWLLFSIALFLAPSCKSNFEKVRTSGDAELILTKAFDLYEKKQYQRALTLFDLVLNALRGDARAEKAYYQYAYSHYHTKQYLLAAHYLKLFPTLLPIQRLGKKQHSCRHTAITCFPQLIDWTRQIPRPPLMSFNYL